MRCSRLIAQAAFLAALMFAFPPAGSAFSGALVVLTPTGASPAVLTIPAGMYPLWTNNDHVTHTVTFANGLCSLQVAPGDVQGCNDEPWVAGQYAYTVDGTIQASVVVNALPPPTVSLTARSHTIPRGRAQVRLHGTLNPSTCCGPPIFVLRMPIIVLARHDRHHPFRPIATVRSEKRMPYGGGFAWQLNLHPKTKTIYIAEVNYQPQGEQGQRPAWSRPFKVSPSGKA